MLSSFAKEVKSSVSCVKMNEWKVDQSVKEMQNTAELSATSDKRNRKTPALKAHPSIWDVT